MDHIEEIPSDLEIKHDVWSCATNRALGYDGFNMRFIKEMWGSIGKDFIQFVQQFFISGEFSISINITWVIFVPNKQNSKNIHDFRPISVVGRPNLGLFKRD